jgi:hypothetical protein
MPKFEHFRGGVERSGKLHEAMLLGEVRKDTPEYQEQLKNLGADARGYLPFVLAVELAMMFQPLVKTENPWTHRPQLEKQDPTNPEKGFPKDLRLAIAEQLGLESDEEMNRLKYYTAVGSPLDLFHGVDAFIVLEGKNPGDPFKMVTFDVTLKSEASAKQDAKANVIIRELDEPISKKYLQQVDDYAKEAAAVLTNTKK